MRQGYWYVSDPTDDEEGLANWVSDYVWLWDETDTLARVDDVFQYLYLSDAHDGNVLMEDTLDVQGLALPKEYYS